MGRWMPRALRMEWGNLTEERQESFITALMHLLQGLIPTEHRASFRTIRQGCDAQRCKELHFLEPAKIEQFAHIGRALNMFQTLPPTLTNLSYAPIKFHLNYTAAGNSVDRDFMPYSVCISIRNATVPWRQEAAMYNLLGKLTPTLLGAVVSPLIGKPYVLGVDGRSQRNSTWLLRIHGKVAEWIFATGKISLSEDMPLENQICFEEQYPDQLMYCSQCTNWGHHKEIEGGLAGCSAPGTCSYCGQNTSRSLYKQHELECKKTLDSIKCVHCKTQADFYHDPSKPGNCPVSHCNLLAKLKKLEARQESYNIRFLSEITRRVIIKGGDINTLLSARRDIWMGITQTDRYLALHNNLSGMDTIPSTWDQHLNMGSTGTHGLFNLTNYTHISGKPRSKLSIFRQLQTRHASEFCSKNQRTRPGVQTPLENQLTGKEWSNYQRVHNETFQRTLWIQWEIELNCSNSKL